MIIVIWSSPNKDGLTATAKNKIIEGLSAVDPEIEEIHLNKFNLEHCRACGSGWGLCQTAGHCVIKDDFEKLYEKLVRADGIVWISAVYWHDLTEHMKTFLDRIRRCETAHNGFLKGKRNMIIACAGGTGLGAIQCLEHLEATLSHMGMVTLDRLPIIQFNKSYMLSALLEAGEKFSLMLKTIQRK
ncbi:MAG: flavodoxin family protein [Lachnospiraceae bacterium]|nr:flavodoxin family protein [Lachnospiraceae bacterium]